MPRVWFLVTFCAMFFLAPVAIAAPSPQAPAGGSTATGGAPKKKKKKPAAAGEKATDAAQPVAPVEVYGPPPPVVPEPAPSLARDNILEPSAEPYHFTRGKFLVGAKVGGLFPEPFGGLGASFLVGVEVGWVPNLPKLKDTLALVVELAYTQPGASGTTASPAVEGGSYTWSLTQRELMLGVEVVYRATWIKSTRLKLDAGRLVPYIGIGPRFFFLQTLVSGKQASGAPLPDASEQSMHTGLAVPVGVDLLVGPGRIFLEMSVLWAPFTHNTTGPTTSGAITLAAGYRFLL